MKRIFAFGLSLLLFSELVRAAYSGPVKITAVESQGSDVSIYVDNGSIPENPANCQVGSTTQLFLNNDENLQRAYSAALAALATQSDVQLLISAGACSYNHRVVIGIRVNRG